MGVVIRLSPPADPPPDSLAAGYYFAADKLIANAFVALYRTNQGYGVEVAEQPSSCAGEGQIILPDAIAGAWQSQLSDGRTFIHNQCISGRTITSDTHPLLLG